jgi:hypothetical protein
MLRLLGLLIAFFLLASCGETVAEPSAANESSGKSEVVGDLFVSAVDAVSGNSVSNVKFFMPAMDKEPRESSGISGTVYRNLPIGENYLVGVSAKGYASAVCNASIKFTKEQIGQNTLFAENATLTVPLRKLSASLRGSVFYQNLANPLQLDLFPASNAKLSVIAKDDVNCSYEQRIFGPVSVNEDGFFSFDSLPEKADYSIIVHDAVLGGLLYSGMQSEGTLGVSSNSVILPRMVYEVVQTAFGFVISSDNRSVAGKNDTLKFGFSEPVNISLLRNGDLSVSKTEASTVSVAVDFVWDSLNKNLAIAPAFGEWESGQSYTIRIKLHSLLSSKIIDTTLVFLVKEFSDISKDFVRGIKLDNPAVNYNTYSVTLRWNEMKNAEAYEIYTKSSSRFETIYSLTGEVTTKTNGKTDTAFFLQTYNLLINGDSVLVLIAARNGKGKSSFGEPFAIKDNVPPQFTEGPYINPDTANYVINATTYFNGTVNESILPTDINFNEPMDTSAVLSINIPTLTPRPLKAELKWQSTTSLRISFGIGAGTLNEGKEILKIPVTVSGFKDIAGNKFMGTTVGTKTWEGLLILIYADGVPQS